MSLSQCAPRRKLDASRRKSEPRHRCPQENSLEFRLQADLNRVNAELQTEPRHCTRAYPF